MLKIDQLQFAYEGQDTPWIFDLEVEPGTITAITGPSGAGKSTLLDLIAGFLEPASGDVLLDGERFTSLPPEGRPVSILFQYDNLFDHLSVEKNVELGLSRKMLPAEKTIQIEDALGQMDLSGYGARRASRLSGGQKQRVALARTLLRDRPVLLLDEPFAALDAQTASAIRHTVRDMVRQQGWHTLIVSHLREDAESFADERLHLKGRSLTSG